MGFINLLKNGYRGKLGETVGQQWKNQLTVRTYQATNNSKSQAQLEQRGKYKQMIAIASKYWPTAHNVKAPKKKSMSDFNYYAPIAQEIHNTQIKMGKFAYIGQYNKKDIICPAVFTKDGSAWLYVNLPQGNPKEDSKTITEAIFISAKANSGEPAHINNLLTGKILEKKIKAGAINNVFQRGYFVEAVNIIDNNTIAFISIGKKKGSMIKWSGIIFFVPALPLSDDMLEDL